MVAGPHLPAERPRVALAIAGTDPCGGAGVAADLRVMDDLGVAGTFIVTAVIAQNTRGVFDVFPLPPAQVLAQLDRLLEDVDVDGVKIGALGSVEVARALIAPLRAWKGQRPGRTVVVDPVLGSGQNAASIGGPGLVEAIAEGLLPLADAITPNVPEAERLLGRPIADEAAMDEAARRLVALGAGAALVKGGHIAGGAADVLAWRLAGGGAIASARLPIEVRYGYDVRGTGCHLASALSCGLVGGASIEAAARAARAYTDRLWADRAVAIGRGARVFFHGERQRGPKK